MTTILAMDTATESLSVALWQGKALATATLQIGLKHSVTLMPLVDDLCHATKLDKKEIDAIACTLGPGSFTGLRIGAATALGMAYARALPTLGFSTLQVMAEAMRPGQGRLLCPLLDARNDRVFAGAWHGRKNVVPEKNWRLPDFLAAANEAASRLQLPGLWLSGSGRETFIRQGMKLEASGHAFAPALADSPRADVLAALAAESLATDPPASAPDTWQRLMPHYLSPSQAERLREKREKADE